MKTKIILLIALLIASVQGFSQFIYGVSFGSGFDNEIIFFDGRKTPDMSYRLSLKSGV